MAGYSLAHLGYVVRDLDTGLRRFVAEGARIVIEPGDDLVQRVRVCVLALDNDAARVELVAPLGEESPVTARLQRGGGLDHVCYRVDNIDCAVQAESDAGALVVCDPVAAAVLGGHVAFVQRRSGMVIELWQPGIDTP